MKVSSLEVDVRQGMVCHVSEISSNLQFDNLASHCLEWDGKPEWTFLMMVSLCLLVSENEDSFRTRVEFSFSFSVSETHLRDFVTCAWDVSWWQSVAEHVQGPGLLL